MSKKVYVEVKDNLPINVDIQNAIDGFQYLGHSIYKFRLEDIMMGKMDNIALNLDNIFVGSIDAMNMLFKNINKTPNPIDFPDSILSKKLIKRKIYKTHLFDFIKNFKENKIPKFVKPIKTKLFDGILISKQEHLHFLNNYDNCEVYISDVIDILSEHRVYVHKRKAIYSCNYSGDFRINPDFNYIDKLIDNYENQPIAYTIDVAILKDNSTTVIEFNDFFAIGSYGLYSIDYSKMLLDRYKEIIK